MSELRIDSFWCQECGQSLVVCNGEEVCTEARKRSIIGLRGIYVSILPFLFVKVDTLPFTIALQEHLENEAIKEMKRQEEKVKQLKGDYYGTIQGW